MTEFLHRGWDKKSQNLALFTAIARRYDFLNHFLSLGIDLWWRRKLVKQLPQDLSGPLLDAATGTGDLAFAILKRFPGVPIVGIDNTPVMLELARNKMAERQIFFKTIESDAENLPFKDGYFQVVTIAFGLRNIGFYSDALKEFYRVLNPGGRLLVLEFGQPDGRIFGPLYSFYFHHILPVLGMLISRSRAYRYLPESVDNFPPRAELQRLVAAAGFGNSEIKRLTGGVVSLVSATKPTV